MKYIWIIFIIIIIQDIIYNKIQNNKKEFIIYCSISIIGIALCIFYYSNEYSHSLLKLIDDKINLERIVWIK